ncbi:DUF2510 domain-containing protein [Kitasatospora sp. NE20-6]|uniref:DUF2510 domain-containing protein n=1 Tax=Kitasatospora sp. NE20-6 TaxID=2859066 RepID=UPI0038B29A50
MSEQIPAGWYPDPKDTTTDPRPERYWDGTGWTATTRPAPGGPAAAGPDDAAPGGTTVLEGRILEDDSTVRYPELPPMPVGAPPKKARRKPSRAVVVAAAVAAVAGLAVGSGVTYAAMDDGPDAGPRIADGRGGARPGGGDAFAGPEGGFPGFGLPGQGEGNGQGNGQGGGNGRGNGNGNGQGGGQGGGSQAADTAVDVRNAISLPVPAGWTGGTNTTGYAALSIGSYTCADGKTQCSLAGANSGNLTGSDAKQAALADIAAAAEDSYGKITSHQEVKSEAVTVNGRSGYLVRWKVDAPQGNDGYVETVVFPGAKAGTLISVHLGFDIADKAPDVAVMDTIVKGIATAEGAGAGVGGTSDGTNT